MKLTQKKLKRMIAEEAQGLNEASNYNTKSLVSIAKDAGVDDSRIKKYANGSEVFNDQGSVHAKLKTRGPVVEISPYSNRGLTAYLSTADTNDFEMILLLGSGNYIKFVDVKIGADLIKNYAL